MEAPHGYFITVNFQDFVFVSEESGCAGGYLELSDGVHDSDHMRRYCSSVMRSRQWFTSSNKLLLEYLVDAEDTFSNFALRLDQTKACVLPQLPPGAVKLSCRYEGKLKIVCKLKCKHEVEEKKLHCTLHYGMWVGDFTYVNKIGHKIRRKPLYKLLNCRHKVDTYIIHFMFIPMLEEDRVSDASST